jgi:hypothetical protein
MAQIKLGSSISDIRGKVGGDVFSKNRTGNYIKQKKNKKGLNTLPWQQQKVRVGAMSREWRNLSDEQRSAWRDAALTFTVKNKVGDDVNMSGFQYFVSVNSTQGKMNNEIMFNPPIDGSYFYPTDLQIISSEYWQYQTPLALGVKNYGNILSSCRYDVPDFLNDSQADLYAIYNASFFVNLDFLKRQNSEISLTLFQISYSGDIEIRADLKKDFETGIYVSFSYKKEDEEPIVFNCLVMERDLENFLSVCFKMSPNVLETSSIACNWNNYIEQGQLPFIVPDTEVILAIEIFSHGENQVQVVSPVIMQKIPTEINVSVVQEIVRNYIVDGDVRIIDWKSADSDGVDYYVGMSKGKVEFNFNNSKTKLFQFNTGNFIAPSLALGYQPETSNNQNIVVSCSRPNSPGVISDHQFKIDILNKSQNVLGVTPLSLEYSKAVAYTPNNSTVDFIVRMFNKVTGTIDRTGVVPLNGKVKFKAGSELSSRVN